ncbi:MAG TPA: DUF1553 domain-containing protein [Tepidisphaeraceae bacterium]|nr:DUF1553 domain-containing protein [Tepidisphaeraceae bacterium]
MIKPFYVPICLVVVVALAGLGAAAAAQPVDYARDVLPILSDNCYHCHGPDENARKAKLRLDTKEGAFGVKDGVTIVAPHNPAGSELLRRITSKDPDEVMPPHDDIRKLKPAQVETLKRWVEQGATWGEHWAFVPPMAPTIPDGEAKNPIDALVRAKLRDAKLQPAPEADKATLIRRVMFDLTGLPPTPAEIDAFIADTSEEAYEKVVDRLLASPRYGERMASDWLDLARFADTHGYQMDRYRPTWPWRDWVIKSFNDNLPYDQFVTWQLAGDLLPDPTKEQRIATAFNRHHMQNEEGGIVEEEFRVAYVVDRVNAAGTAFLGLTMDCARCHDHKYDPITQRDFYAMFAFFQNIDESGQTPYFTSSMPVPTVLLSTDEQDAKLAELRASIAARENQLAALREPSREPFRKWLAEKGEMPAGISGGVVHHAFDELAQDNVKVIEGPALVEGKIGKAALLDGENGFTFGGDVGKFSRAEPFTLSLWLQTPSHAPRMVVAHKSKAPIDAGSRGYELLLENGRVALGLHHMWPGNSLKVVTKSPVPIDEWTHVTATYDGSSKAAGVRIYINGAPAELEIIRDGLWKDITYGGEEPPLAIGHRFRDNGFKGGKVDEFRVFNRALTPLEAMQLAGRKDFEKTWAAADASSEALLDYFVATVHAPIQQLSAELASLRKTENDLVTPIPEIMAMQELPTPKPAFVLMRGAYDAPGEPVTADTPAFLPPFPKSAPRNRLGFARWLLDPGNPLTARVTVNRAWQQMFGVGLVETSDNFGTQGAQPINQPLLDHLARAFVGEMRWDMKRLLKTIALSATYRQSSRAAPELLAADPANALLARGPARRLTAEMLRDQALLASNLLVEKLGGPSVRPYQPDGLWDVAMGKPTYDQDKGEGLYRRSLYTFWKRTVPPPAMTLFDAADRSNCTVQRQSTSTPLQALALLNDPQIVEAARFVSQRMLMEDGATLDDRIGWAVRLLTGRAANSRELEVLKQLYAEQRALFAADPDAATKLLKVGEKPNDETLDRADLAAGTVLAIALFNHDGAVMRR